MIQFNLLPDVKLEYIRAERTKRLVAIVAIIISGASVALLLLMLIVMGAQKARVSSLTKSINDQNKTLQSKQGINTILTVQNQLSKLTDLHSAKPAANRLFDYLNQLTPTNASITNMTIDFVQNSVSITGEADNLGTVNQFIDTLKLTKYAVKDSGNNAAFSNVVLTNFSVSSGNDKSGKSKPTYTINASFDPKIFNISTTVVLTVPQTQTRAQVQSSTGDLFQQSTTTTTGAKQ